jgi:hypothetical protein
VLAAATAGHVTEFAKILPGRHGEQLDTWISAVDAADLISKVTDAMLARVASGAAASALLRL